jgi:hypothetical protein
MTGGCRCNPAVSPYLSHVNGSSTTCVSCCYVAWMGEERGVCRVLVGKPEEKRPLGRPRRRWENNIRMDLQQVECGGVDWTGSG